jgi:cytochrome c
MSKCVLVSVLATLLFASSAAFADADLAKKHNCVACHLADKKKYGPSFKDIAAKYQGQKTASAKLARKIRAGGTGVWGQDPMPPQPGVSKADASKLATYILSVN